MSVSKWAYDEKQVDRLNSSMIVMGQASSGELLRHAVSSGFVKSASEYEDDDEAELEDEHELMSIDKGVAIIQVRGTLIEGSAGWWGKYYDIVGYDDIRNAVTCAVNAGAQQILVNLMSPGGMVLGIGSLSDYLAKVDAMVPITFFAEAYAASGGVWLSTSTGKFFASRHAEIGSIGVISVASEYTEWDKEMGISRRVFKSTPLKASGNPNEKLDDANAAEIQRGVMESAQRFIDQVAQGMGLTSDYVAKSLATGQIWYADEALRLGLLRGITTYEELLVDLQRKVSQNIDSNAQNGQPIFYNQRAETDMAKRKTIKADPDTALALAASGVIVAEDDVTESEGEQPEEESPVEEQNDDEEENVVEKTKDSEASSISSLNKALLANIEQLAEAKVESASARAEVKSLSAKLEAATAMEDHLKAVVAKKIQHAMAAVGSPIPELASLTSMSAEALLVQNDNAEALLTKRYGQGGQHTLVHDDDGDAETAKANQAAQAAQEILAPLSRFLSK